MLTRSSSLREHYRALLAVMLFIITTTVPAEINLVYRESIGPRLMFLDYNDVGSISEQERERPYAFLWLLFGYIHFLTYIGSEMFQECFVKGESHKQ